MLFFSGVLTEPMGKELEYGDNSCYLTSDESISTNQTKEACKDLKDQAS